MLQRQSKLLSLCHLTKVVVDPVDQEVQDMLRKGAIAVSDLKEDQFISFLFLVKKRDSRSGETPSSQPKGSEQ